MKEAYKFIILPDDTEREVDWDELNQLKKDILWVYDENYGDIGNAFVPSYSFKAKYWEYLTLNGDKWFSEEEKAFYNTGVLMILLCLCSEYIDIAGGNQEVFQREEIPLAVNFLDKYQPKSKYQKLIKDKILLGLSIAQSMTEDNLNDNEFVHEKAKEYYEGINELGNSVIRNYYELKLKN